MMRKNTMFMRLHPLVNLLYFLIIMLLTMLYQNPILLGITGITAFGYSAYLGGRKQLKGNVCLLPMMFLLGLLNPIFNHRGETVLFFFRKEPITLEAVLYGMAAAAMIYDMILLFEIFQKIMTSEKLYFVLSKLLPMGAILFTMTLRFVPMYKEQLKKMRIAQEGIGFDVSQGNIVTKVKNGVELISGLFTWALENALETSDSMRGRGYGGKGRTYYNSARFTKLDWKVICLEGICIAVFLLAMGKRVFTVQYYPGISWAYQGKFSFLYYGIFFLLAAFPLMLDRKEEIIWHYLKQKI